MDWNKEVIKDDKNRKLTRKDIVLFVCHKDGGAHIDENLDDQIKTKIKIGELLCKLIRPYLPIGRSRDDFIVNVGDILEIIHLISSVTQIFGKKIKEQICPRYESSNPSHSNWRRWHAVSGPAFATLA